MNITVRHKSDYACELIFETENVKITEVIEDRIYYKTEDGKTDFKRRPKRDVKTDVLEQFTSVLYDIMHYREADFDSSDLIKKLFEKLPQKAINKLITELKQEYEPDDQLTFTPEQFTEVLSDFYVFATEGEVCKHEVINAFCYEKNTD